MSRSFSVIGLPKGFKSFKEKKGLTQVSESSFKEHFYSEGYALKVYEDKDKNQYEEFECGTSWQSGPELYLGLREKETGKVIFSWTESQMGFEEEIILEGYNLAIKNVDDLFIKEENEERVKGYCGLTVEVKNLEVILSQQQSRNNYKRLTFAVPLKKEEDGPKFRDLLSQKGYRVEEI